MTLTLYRHLYTRWGVDGTLEIRGRRVCDTVEHPLFRLPAGTYTIEFDLDRRMRKRMPTLTGSAIIRRGNGPFRCKDGSIIVGKSHIEGIVLQTRDTFDRLYERLEKCAKRGEAIRLTIND